MRGVVFSVVLLVLPAVLFGQTKRLDTETAVRQALAQAGQGTYTSTVQKELGRLGDASAVALTRIIGDKALEERDVEPILLIVTLSYSDPHIIENDSDRRPRTTLFLLHYLDLATNEAKLKEKVATTQAYIRDQYAKSLKQGEVTGFGSPLHDGN